MKYYKLVGYKPFWINVNNTYCEQHIEDIVKNSETIKWEELKKPVIQMVDMFHLTIIMEFDQEAFDFNYLKLTDNEINYYYKLETIHSIMSNGKNNKFQYALTFILDEYQTIYLDKLNILKNKNPQVYFIRKYCNRVLTKEVMDSDGNIKLQSAGLNFITQRNLSQTIPLDYVTIRKSNWDGCSCQELLEWNYSDTEVVKWEDDFIIRIKFNQWGCEDKQDIRWNQPWKYFKEPNEHGRYRYLVCKSSALLAPQKETKTELVNANTQQTILLIPFFNNWTWTSQGINDIDITKPQWFGAISPLGDNFIGIYECDLPYAVLFAEGFKNNWQKISFHYTTNRTTHPVNSKDIFTNPDFDIPFFTLDINYTFDIFIKEHDTLLKRLKDCEFNCVSSKWDINSEPLLLAPSYYKTILNNGGDGLFLNTADNIILPSFYDYKKPFLRVRPLFDDSLSLAIDYGNYTNYNNIKFDNTNTNIFEYSIKNSFMGSSAANYYSNNVTMALTGIQNLKNQQAQDWGDFGFDTATKTISAASKMKFNILHPIKSMIGNAATAATAGLSIAKQAYDTTMSHQRENNSLYSQINNTTQSPNLNMGKPFIKGYIENPYVQSILDPTKKTYGLFAQYELEPQEQDKIKIFNDILNYGYIYNAWGLFNEYDNRIYMNILNIDCDKSYNNIMNALKEQTGPFNNKSFNQMFINWLNENNKLYKTTTYINVTDSQAKDYISNYERIWTNL